MPDIRLSDRIKEKSYSIGIGEFYLDEAYEGSSRFSSEYSSGDSLYYAISNGVDYEIGSGVYVFDDVDHYLIRFPVESTNGDLLVDFPVGLKEVYVTYPAKFSVFTASGQHDFQQPAKSGVAFWGSRHVLSYDSNFSWDNDNKRLGILNSNPQYAIDVMGAIEDSSIRSSGVIVGDSGIMFSGISPLYSGGRQLEPFMRTEVDDTTGTEDVFDLSGVVDQRLLFKKQLPSHVFAGPSGDCGCVSDYPVFRPLRFDDVDGVDQIINASGNLVVPVYDTVQDVESNITWDQVGAIAFASVDSYIMIANGTSWVSGKLI